jgi:flagellar motor switch protein FliG
MDVIASTESLSGVEKASIMMLALSQADVAKLLGLLDHHEVMEISQTIAVIGRVEASVVENLLVEFGERLARNGGVVGGFDATEKLLLRALDPGRAESIMQEIRGPAGRTVWDKLAHVNEAVLASYLKNEYPQTAAVVLSRIDSAHAARVLSHLPDDFATEVVIRMLRMEVVQSEIVADVERTLRAEFMSNLARSNRRDNHELMAEIFNFRPGDRVAVHRRARGAQQGDGGPHQGPDVHLRGLGQARPVRHPDADALGR